MFLNVLEGTWSLRAGSIIGLCDFLGQIFLLLKSARILVCASQFSACVGWFMCCVKAMYERIQKNNFQPGNHVF